MVPLSAEVYFASLADYSQSIWPRQLVFICLGLMMIILAVRPKPFAGRISAIILSTAWVHVGYAYHLSYFAELNFWDYPIGIFFLVQSAVIFWFGVIQDRFPSDRQQRISVIAMASALILPPLLGLFLDRTSEQLQLFGVTPGPTVLFTGAYLCAIKGWLRILWLVPLLLLIPIAILASALGIFEDFVVLVLPALLLLAVIRRAIKQ